MRDPCAGEPDAELAEAVAARVFPDLVRDLAARDPQAPAPLTDAYLAELRGAAVTLLCGALLRRLAEDRGVPAAAAGGAVARAAGEHPLLARTPSPDAALAPLLARLGGPGPWPVRLLGAVHERLLALAVRVGPDGGAIVRPDAGGRRTSGSYYTPAALVRLVIERAVGPLVADRVAAFEATAARLAADRRPVPERLRALVALDPAARLLELRICDPAMGTGHFLVALVDWLADRILAEVAAAPGRVPWAPAGAPYRSPLAGGAGQGAPAAGPAGRARVRRLVAERVVFGVDRDPLAVALARAALGLHAATAGAPAAVPDAHLRCGDALLDDGAGPGGALPAGAFDAVVGNPPWERVKLQQVEWFAARRPAIARAPRAADRRRLIAALEEARDPLWAEYRAAAARAEATSRRVRASGAFPLLGRGDLNLYALFVERAAQLVAPDGVVGLLVPSGIAADRGASAFFRAVAATGRLGVLLDFENRRPYFPAVDRRFKFCVLVFGGPARTFAATDCAFHVRDGAELAAPGRVFPLAPADFAALNPNTGTAPFFRTGRDARITAAIYRRVPPLVDRRAAPARNPWGLRYVRMFDLTNDSHRFRPAAAVPAADPRHVPLYEGKMVQAYDHRAASVVLNPANVHRPARPRPASAAEHADPAWRPAPQFRVPREAVPAFGDLGWVLCFKDVTSPTNARTLIAAAAPLVGFGNKLPLLVPADASPAGLRTWRAQAPLLLANLNSLVLDYVARQKVHGQTINLFILEQLPVLPPAAFERELGGRRVADLVRDDVLRLTYTAHDLAPFARDQGWAGPPFPWDEEDRRDRLARLDALFFHLYELSRDDVAHVLDTFPIVRAQDERRWGEPRTKRAVLAHWDALAKSPSGAGTHYVLAEPRGR